MVLHIWGPRRLLGLREHHAHISWEQGIFLGLIDVNKGYLYYWRELSRNMFRIKKNINGKQGSKRDPFNESKDRESLPQSPVRIYCL